MSKRQAFLLWCGILFFASVPGAVQGAAIQWRDLVPMAPPEVSGKVVEAVNLAGGAVVVGGVSFQAGDATAPAPLHSNLFKVLTSVWAGPTGAATGNADLDLMLRGGRWIAGTAKLTLTFSSLNPGTTYQIQFYIADFRTALQIGRAYHFEDESGHASPVFTRGGKMSVIGTFRADSDLQNIFFVCESGSQDPLLNGYVLSTCVPKGVAFDPDPENRETDVLRDGVLGWTPSEHAQTHDVYFGTVFDDVNSASRTNPRSVLASEGQSTTMYDPGRLAFGTTYYWRVDEVNAPPTSTIVKGETWSFTTEPVAYPVDGQTIIAAASSADAKQGPENTVNGAGLANDLHSNDLPTMWVSAPGLAGPAWIQYELAQPLQLHEMWVWNHDGLMETTLGLGAKDVTIEYSSDGTTFQTLGTTHEFARALGQSDYAHNTTIAFGDVAVKIVKLTIHSNWGGILAQYGLSEVRFYSIPVMAREPEPADDAAAVHPQVTLSWRAGREAASHQVLLSTDAQAVIDGTAPAATASAPAHEAALNLSTTYYWKVVEVNNAEALSAWPGDVWSFTTADFVAVEDFESYTDDDGQRIYQSWIDGYDDPANGSLVGYAQAPFAEQTTVHSGEQSMPLEYANTGGAAFSEAKRTFDTAQDWTKHGVTSLVLYFQGKAANSPASLYVKINDKKIVYNNGAPATTLPLWKQWNIDLASSGAALKSVKSFAIGVEGSGSGMLFLDDIRLYEVAPEIITPANPGTTGLVALYALDGNVQDSSGKNNHGTVGGTAGYESGPSGQAIICNGTNTYVTLPIGATIAALSDATLATNVYFANTGGSWQRIFDFGTGTTTYMFLSPRQATSGSMRFAIRTATVGEQIVDAPATLPSGWHHVAVVIDSKAMTLTLYLDGEAVGTAATTLLPKDLGNTTQNWLGRSQWAADAYFTGSLDEFRIYNRALSAAEVRYLAGDR